MSIKNILEKLSAIAITIFFSVVILEFGLRYIGEAPSNTTSGFLEQDGDSYRLKKNAVKNINWPAFSYTVYTNSYGFRDESTGEKKINDKGYYIFLGASEVFGNGVEYEDTFVGIIDDYTLRTKGKKVLNMAIGGHYFIDQQMLLKKFISQSQKKPETIFFCVNALHIPKFDKRNEHVKVINGDLFNKENWEMAFIRLMLGNISSAYCFFRDKIRQIQSKYLNYTPSNKSNEFLNIYSKSNRMREKDNVSRFYDYLDSFKNFCYENQIQLVFIYTPITDSYRLAEMVSSLGQDPKDYDTSYYIKMMEEYCMSRSVDFINIRDVLQEQFDKGEELRFKLDPHYNKFANRIIGQYLINKLFK